MAENQYDEKCTYFDSGVPSYKTMNNNNNTIRTNTVKSDTTTCMESQKATTAGTASSYTWPPKPKGEIGWICPKCGRGIAPWKSYCECSESWTITCANKVSNPHSTGVDFNPDWSQVTCGDIDSGGGYVYHGTPPTVTLTH